ncbi:MAG: hypothetical protein AB1847_11835 [bacterium]
MKKAVLILLVVAFLGSVAVPAFASGGQHRGDKGQGQVNQEQVRNK